MVLALSLSLACSDPGADGPSDAASETDESGDTGDTGDTTDTTDTTDTGDEAPHCVELGDAIELSVQDYRAANELVGLTLSVDSEGCEPRSYADGEASRASASPLQTDHLLRVGSVTKTFTATLMLELSRAGLASLDDSLADWEILIPDADMITIRSLLNHTSGLADYQYNPAFAAELSQQPDRVWTAQELIDYALELGPLAAPGEAFAYSNTNYVIAGVIAEAATGESYADALRTWVIDPMGLEHTYVEGEDQWTETMAEGHLVQGGVGPQEVTSLYHASQVGPAGAVVATVDDLRRFTSTLLASDFLGDAGQAELIDFVDTMNPGLESYGLGVFTFEAGSGVAVGHNGAVMGFQAGIGYHPGSRATVVAIQNQLTVDGDGAVVADPLSLVAAAIGIVEAIELESP